jgi:hypothetical protein
MSELWATHQHIHTTCAVPSGLSCFNLPPLLSQVLQSIKGCQAELALLRDRSASAWEALLRHYGETKQSCSTDTEFWADMQVRWPVALLCQVLALILLGAGYTVCRGCLGFEWGETKQSCSTNTEFWADMQVRDRFVAAAVAVLSSGADMQVRDRFVAAAVAVLSSGQTCGFSCMPHCSTAAGIRKHVATGRFADDSAP